MGNAPEHRGPRASLAEQRDGHAFQLGEWRRLGRRRYELRLWRFDPKQGREVTRLFALVLDDQGQWHMWTVDEKEWPALATPGLLTAKVRFYNALRAAGWHAKPKERESANAN